MILTSLPSMPTAFVLPLPLPRLPPPPPPCSGAAVRFSCAVVTITGDTEDGAAAWLCCTPAVEEGIPQVLCKFDSLSGISGIHIARASRWLCLITFQS